MLEHTVSLPGLGGSCEEDACLESPMSGGLLTASSDYEYAMAKNRPLALRVCNDRLGIAGWTVRMGSTTRGRFPWPRDISVQRAGRTHCSRSARTCLSARVLSAECGSPRPTWATSTSSSTPDRDASEHRSAAATSPLQESACLTPAWVPPGPRRSSVKRSPRSRRDAAKLGIKLVGEFASVPKPA